MRISSCSIFPGAIQPRGAAGLVLRDDQRANYHLLSYVYASRLIYVFPARRRANALLCSATATFNTLDSFCFACKIEAQLES